MASGFIAAVDEIVLETPLTAPPDTSRCPPLEQYTTLAPVTSHPTVTLPPTTTRLTTTQAPVVIRTFPILAKTRTQFSFLNRYFPSCNWINKLLQSCCLFKQLNSPEKFLAISKLAIFATGVIWPFLRKRHFCGSPRWIPPSLVSVHRLAWQNRLLTPDLLHDCSAHRFYHWKVTSSSRYKSVQYTIS